MQLMCIVPLAASVYHCKDYDLLSNIPERKPYCASPKGLLKQQGLIKPPSAAGKLLVTAANSYRDNHGVNHGDNHDCIFCYRPTLMMMTDNRQSRLLYPIGQYSVADPGFMRG